MNHLLRVLIDRNEKGLLLVALVLAACAAQPAGAQLPAARLNSIFPAGGQQGQSFSVSVAGSDLDDVSQLVFSHPGITATQKVAAADGANNRQQASENQFAVTIASEVPLGLYEARVIGRFGISSPRAFMVGQWPESVEVEPNQPEATDFAHVLKQANEVTINSTVNGVSSGGTDLDYFKFMARRGQRVLIDCWAHRIDSRLDGTLAVFDSQGRQLAASRDVNRRDPLIDLDVPADGIYVVKLWDFVYGGDGAARSAAGDYFYRLAIGVAPYIDYIFPSAGQPGTTGQFTVYGRNLPGGIPAEGLKIDGRPLEQLVVQIPVPSGPATEHLQFNSLVESKNAALDGFEYRVSSQAGHSNPVLIGFAGAPVVTEHEPNDTPAAAQRLVLPCEYAGQFQKTDDSDWISFEARKGDVYIVEVIARRQLSRCDPLLVVQRVTMNNDGSESVSELQKLDDFTINLGGYTFDTRSDDPLYRFVAPEDGLYRILLADLSQAGDPRSVYRLCLRREAPDFRLVAVPVSRNRQEKKVLTGVPLLRKGGTAAIEVLAFRRDGFAQEILLSARGLPPGVACLDAVIGPASSSAALVFHAAEDAPAWAGSIQIVGKSKIDGDEVVREARCGSVIWNSEVQNNEAADARLTRNITLAVSGVEQAPYTVEPGAGQVYEISRPGKLEIPLKVTRRGDFRGALTLAAVGLPKDVRLNNVNFESGKEEAILQVEVLPGAPLGAYSFYFTASGEVPYKRSSERGEKSNNLIAVEPSLPLTVRINPDSSGKER